MRSMRSMTRNVGSSRTGFLDTMPNPWDIPPIPETANADPDDIFRAVGGALSGWESVEHTLADIFTLLVEAKPPPVPFDIMTPAARAYGSVVSFQARSAMVEAAARVFFRLHPH